MYWDASQAYNNARFDTSVKNSLVAAGGTGFTYPACTAPAYATGGNYPAGSQVTYNGCAGHQALRLDYLPRSVSYIWKARWFASGIPDANINDKYAVLDSAVLQKLTHRTAANG
jgi:chitinase